MSARSRRACRLPVALALALIAALGLAAMPALAAKVDLALVLAVDVSESVDAEEYELQHEGIARAFETAPLIDAIKQRPERRHRCAGAGMVGSATSKR